MSLEKLNTEQLKEYKKNKPLYKPVVSTREAKKGMTYVMKDGKKRLIHFGDKSMSDYRLHKDEKRRKNYLARATKIKNKAGEYTYKDKNSPNYYSVKYLWAG
jgi:CRISPR/Cas system CMR subunit Cmr4 (Cas7 group RAMP superfamily)